MIKQRIKVNRSTVFCSFLSDLALLRFFFIIKFLASVICSWVSGGFSVWLRTIRLLVYMNALWDCCCSRIKKDKNTNTVWVVIVQLQLLFLEDYSWLIKKHHICRESDVCFFKRTSTWLKCKWNNLANKTLKKMGDISAIEESVSLKL